VSNRWLRFVIAILALVASGAAGYRIFRQEQRLASDVATARTAEHAAHSSLATIAEIKAALHAYVAAGQGHPFWTTRAAMLIDELRGSMLELDRVAASDGASLTDALDLSDRVAASEQRARDYVVAEQPLLAGDVIFTEGKDLLDALKDHISRAQAQIAAGSATRQAELRREQAILTASSVGVLALAILLLAPGASRSIAVSTSAEEPVPVVRAPQPTRIVSTPRELPQASSDRAAAPPARALPLREAADVCTDLGRVADSTEISALLARASSVLNASGIIVWMASPDLRELYPAASAGYDERVVSRIGSIPRDAANVTASAFRHAAAKTSASLGASPAALAVPLLTPLGATGVFSAELREGSEVEPQQLALARIFAAQLAALLGLMATATEAVPPAQQAQA